jgi:hypothetical protein
MCFHFKELMFFCYKMYLECVGISGCFLYNLSSVMFQHLVLSDGSDTSHFQFRSCS